MSIHTTDIENAFENRDIDIGLMLQSLIVEKKTIVHQEQVVSNACMDGLERSDEIMEGGNEDSHAETDMADLLHRFSAASEVPENHSIDVPIGSNPGYKESEPSSTS